MVGRIGEEAYPATAKIAHPTSRHHPRRPIQQPAAKIRYPMATSANRAGRATTGR